MYRKLYFILILLFSSHLLFSQVYTKKQTRHRFAQLNLGLDFGTSFGGQTKFLDPQGNLSLLDLDRVSAPRFVIGGTHFWGHADFYIATPLLYPSQAQENQDIQFIRGVETAFKYYPLRIEHNKIRPFIGFSITPFYFEQDNRNLDFENGPELNFTKFPILGGLTFNTKKHLLELGFS